MPSAKSIAQIKSALLHPATTSHFEVQIDISKLPLQYLSENDVILNTEKLNLLCSETTLPGSNLATLELNSTLQEIGDLYKRGNSDIALDEFIYELN